jgi:hypothetical protein
MRRFVVEELERINGAPTLIFASLHRNEDGSLDDDCRQFVEQWQPTACKTFCYKPPDPEHISMKASYGCAPMMPYRTASMFYHMHTAWGMLQEYCAEHPEVEVRYVMRTRPDVGPTEPLALPREPEDGVLYVPTTLGEGYPPDWLCDHTAAGNADVMRKYCRTVFDIMFATDQLVPLYLPEYTLLKFVVEPLGLRWVLVPFKYELERGTNRGVDQYKEAWQE